MVVQVHVKALGVRGASLCGCVSLHKDLEEQNDENTLVAMHKTTENSKISKYK